MTISHQPSERPYEPFEHTADIGLRVRGETLPALYENAAAGLMDTMVGLDRIAAKAEQTVHVEANDLEELMVNWLGELLYLFEVEGLVFGELKITNLAPDHLVATVRGESFDPERHPVAADIKAVTYHQLKVEQAGGEWRVSIVFDV